jgi:hypothetical protein
MAPPATARRAAFEGDCHQDLAARIAAKTSGAVFTNQPGNHTRQPQVRILDAAALSIDLMRSAFRHCFIPLL